MNHDQRFAQICGDSKLPKLPKQSRTQRKNESTQSDQLASASSDSIFDAGTLKRLLSTKLAGAQVIVVSNRQPFSQTVIDGQVRLTQPASGLITALEPVVRACDGTWIAHGSEPHDREFVNSDDRCAAPPGHGSYTLRRIWMTPEEQRGYCDGFANSGLWPLSHMVHVRPVLVESDWQHYMAMNQRFADAVLQEARQSDPIVLIQDYHLALVPALVRAKLPRATVISFWHIPWPHPDQMSVCPWLPEIFNGLLGSNIVGLQTPQHVANFVELSKRQGKPVQTAPTCQSVPAATQVRDYPVSIAWPGPADAADIPSVQQCRELVKSRWALKANGRLILGVDRFDYTKGLIERLLAFETLLEQYPMWRGLVRFVQIAAPTRGDLKTYTDFQLQVFSEVERINAKFSLTGAANTAPVVLLDRHHDRAALNVLYRGADVCVVTSLHDGMNLVCKEFVAARSDEQGVLILSQFAGAANELTEALVVNPYHTRQVAQAMHQALDMPPAEQQRRMQALRATVKNSNVYKWASSMLSDAFLLRDKAQAVNLPATPAANQARASRLAGRSPTVCFEQDAA